MSINYENFLYPEEAISSYKEKLLDIYIEDYGEEYTDIIKERMDNTFYFFDSNPIITYEKLYKHAKGISNLRERMVEEADDYIECRDKAIEIYGSVHLDLLEKAFNVKRGNELVDLDLSFLIDKSISKEEFERMNKKYVMKCKSLGVEPIYDELIISILLCSTDIFHKMVDYYLLNNSLWGMRIVGKFQERFKLTIAQISKEMNTLKYPVIGMTTQTISNDNKFNSIIFFPLVHLLDSNVDNIDHCFFHELRHSIEFNNNSSGLTYKEDGKINYKFINEMHTEDNAIRDSKRLEGNVIWKKGELDFVTYQNIFPYVIDFFDKYRELLNLLAIDNDTLLFEDIFGANDLYRFELFIEKLDKIINTDEDYILDDEKSYGKKLIKKLDDNLKSYRANMTNS